MEFTKVDLESLKFAKELLDNPGMAVKITNLIGTPIEKGIKLLPKIWGDNLASATQKALTKAIDAAILTMNSKPSKKSSNLSHKLSVMATGGVGGFFWIAGACGRTSGIHNNNAQIHC